MVCSVQSDQQQPLLPEESEPTMNALNEISKLKERIY